MRREQGKHGLHCRSNKTQKCCQYCRGMLKSGKNGEIYVPNSTSKFSLNKCKNWEILESMEEEITCRKNFETEINGKKVGFITKRSVIKEPKDCDYIVEVPVDSQHLYQQREICSRRRGCERDRNKKKHKNEMYNVDIQLKF